MTQTLGERALLPRLEEWSRRTGIALEVWALPSAPARAVAETVLAALADLEERGGARTVAVAVTGHRLTISDDAPHPPSGAARESMRAAFAATGGRLSIDTVPGEGTTIRGLLPARRR